MNSRSSGSLARPQSISEWARRASPASSVSRLPPSPAVRSLVDWWLKEPNSPNDPAPRSRQRWPWACAQSSTRASPWRRAISVRRSMSAIWWPRCTGMMARVRAVTAASTWSGSTVRVPGEDVAEHRQRPGRHGRVRGGREGQRRDDHLVAPADPEGLEGDLHGDGAVGHHHPVPGALVGREPLGEGGGQRPRLGEPAPAAAPHHLGDRLGVAFVVHRPGRVALGPDRRPAAQRQLRHVVPPVRRRPVASRRGVDFLAPPSDNERDVRKVS